MRNALNAKAFFLALVLSSFSLYAEQEPYAAYEEVIDQNQLKILTPSLSCRQTAKIRLNNGLEALIISDPESNQSAAALAMHVGSWSNPPEYPGMAHFLEHLLFMASETYPQENGYFKQVTNNGGTLNAYTASDRTVYMFSVNHSAFPSTLDYFAHMFIDPLFSPSGIGRELHAVDQEHDKNIESDGFREYMVFKSTGNQNHPNAQFSTGNSETLGGIPREAVVKWYEENYSADKAHLILYSSLPIEELKHLAASIFSEVPLNPNSKSSFNERLTSSSQEGAISYITPVREIRKLSVIWEVPQGYMLDIENKSDCLLAYALNSRHPGSLYSQLKEEGLIDNIYSGLESYSTESGLFEVEFILTPQGTQKFERVIECLYQTLNGFKANGLPPFLFEEMKKMVQINYEYQGRVHPFSYVSQLAHQMVDEALETFPQQTILPANYDPKKCNAFLSLLTPFQAHYHLVASPQLTGAIGEKKERWSGAEYATRKFDSAQLAAWSEAQPALQSLFPESNPFIPSDLRLVTNRREVEKTPIPELIIDTEYGKAYYFEDGRYLVPEVSWVVNIRSPWLDRSAKQIPLLYLIQKCLADELKSTAFYANAAGLSADVHDSELGFCITVNGYSEKAPVFLKEVLQGIKTCSWTPEEFELQRFLLINHYDNFRKAPPLSQGIDLFNNLLFSTSPRMHEQLAALKKLTYDDFQTFQNKFLEEAYVEMMLAGNLTKKEAFAVWNEVRGSLQYAPYAKNKHHQRSILSLQSQGGPYRIDEKVECLGNAALLTIGEGPFSFDKWASSATLSRALVEDFFQTLRTKQQTGYIAQAQGIEEEDHLLQLFYVQSTTHQPDELIARFELFLEDYVNDFETKIPEGQFENIRSTLINLAQQPPSSLSKMAGHLYRLGFEHDGDFLRVEKKIEALKNLDYETFKRDSMGFLSRQNPKRIAILIEGVQPDGKTFRYQGITADELKSQGAYISWRH